MKVRELKDILAGMSDDLDVVGAFQPRYPLSAEIQSVHEGFAESDESHTFEEEGDGICLTCGDGRSGPEHSRQSNTRVVWIALEEAGEYAGDDAYVTYR